MTHHKKKLQRIGKTAGVGRAPITNNGSKENHEFTCRGEQRVPPPGRAALGRFPGATNCKNAQDASWFDRWGACGI